MHCLYGGYNLHRFSDALGLVLFVFCNNLLNKLIYYYYYDIITIICAM